jgi:hypothetical protein
LVRDGGFPFCLLIGELRRGGRFPFYFSLSLSLIQGEEENSKLD